MTQPELNLCIVVIAAVPIVTALALIVCCAVAGAFKGGKRK